MFKCYYIVQIITLKYTTQPNPDSLVDKRKKNPQTSIQ